MKKIKLIILSLILILSLCMFSACKNNLKLPSLDTDIDTSDDISFDETNIAFKKATINLMLKGFYAKADIDVGSYNIKADLTAFLSSQNIINFETEIFNKKISLFVLLGEEDNSVFFNFDKYSVYTDINDIEGIINEVKDILHIGEEDTEEDTEENNELNDILSNISVDKILPSIFDLLESIKGIKNEDNSFSYSFDVLNKFTLEILVNSENSFEKIELSYNQDKNIKASLSEFSYDIEKPVVPLKEESISFNEFLPLIRTFVEEKTENISDILGIVSKTNLSSIIEIVEQKSASLEIDLKYENLAVKGKLSVNFEKKIKDIKLFFEGEINGVELELYYFDSNIYVIKDDIKLICGLDNIFEYVKIFTEKDLKNLIDLKSITFDKIGAYDKKIIIQLSKYTIKIDPLNLTGVVGFDNFNLLINKIEKGNKIAIPQLNYVNVGNVKGVLSEIKAQILKKDFNINGEFNYNGINIKLNDVKIKVNGEGKTKELFDKGLIDIAGTLLIEKDEKQYKIDTIFKSNVLYIKFNEEMKVQLSRASMDGIVNILKDNIDRLINGLAIAGIESMEDIKNMDFSIKNIVSYLKGVYAEKDFVRINVNLSKFNFGNISASVGLKDDGSLFFNLESDGSIYGNLSINNNLVTLEKPIDSNNYIDVSNVEKLIDGLVVTALKESKTYSLKGIIKLGVLGKNINVKIEAYVRIKKVIEENGEGKDKIDAYIEWDATDLPIGGALVIEPIQSQFMKFGKSSLTYTDDKIYISRADMKLENTGFLSYEYILQKPVYKQMTVKEFKGDSIKVILYFLGIKEDLVDKNNSSEKEEIKYEKIFKNYIFNKDKSTHTTVIDLEQIVKMKYFSDATITIHMDENKYLDSMNITVPINFILLPVSVTLDAVHYVNDVYNFDTCINNIKEITYTNFF